MGDIRSRKVAAIIGASCADAAAQPIHWVYNLDTLDKLLSEKEEIEFLVPSANPFYRIDTGLNSCYGDQAYVILESLSREGDVDKEDLMEKTFDFFGPGTDYDNDATKNYKFDQKAGGGMPISNKWRHGSIKQFLKSMEQGNPKTGSETDQQIDGVARIAPVVAMYAGRPEMLDKVKQVVQVTQRNDFTVAVTCAAARILEYYILHGDSGDAVTKVLEDLSDSNRNCPNEQDAMVVGLIKDVLNVKDKPHREAVTKIFANS